MKKFLSHMREYSTTILVDGKPRFVRFRDMGKIAGCGVFVTNDDALATAMIKDARHGSDFILDGYNPDKEEVEVAPARVYDKSYDYIKRTQDAIEVLIKDYGVKRAELKLKADVLRVADELNIAFPKLDK